MKTKFYLYSITALIIGFSIGANAANVPTASTPTSTVSRQVDAPTNVKATLVYKRVVISWNAVSAPIRYYRVEATWGDKTKWYAGPVTRNTSVALNLPTKNLLITYHVVAVGYYELSPASDVATIIVR